MSDTLLNKIHIIEQQKGVTFSDKQKQKCNSELMSELDNRINDMLHRIEFTNATPQQAYKMYMKLQMFLRKKRALKKSGKIYRPRTESGKKIVNGRVI